MAQEIQQRTSRDPILTQIQALEEADRKKVIKTRARRAKVKEEYVGHTLNVFNGQDYTSVHITEDMVKKELGKLAPWKSPTAQMKFLSIPPRKMRLVGELIKGQPVEKALNILNFTPKIAAHHMAKTLKSAVANKLSVEGTAHLDPEHLIVSQVVVEPGPTAKRIQYRSMGRVYRVRKRYCHLAIYLDVDARTQIEQQVDSESSTDKKKASTKGKKRAAKPAKTTAATKKPATKKKTAMKTETTKKKTAAKKTAAKKTTTSSKPAAGKKAEGKGAKTEKKK
jgi:large subunit ribosomal protein L22